VMILGVYPHAVLNLINPTLLTINQTVAKATAAVAALP
jgi:NADH:ubiquinone oxidoreductase subunit 4 (subunit M)